MRRQLITCILAGLLSATAAAELRAQPVPVPSPVPASTQLKWDHDGVNTDRYLLIVDSGAPTDLGKPTPTGQTYAAPFPSLAPGLHTLVLCAENVAGRGCTPPLSVSLVVLPAIPSNFTISISIGPN